ncbi:MAG: hypothetical protein Fur0018_17250 [Anaerolineales bacterium]
MPSIIDPDTLYVDDLPGIWSPVQWRQTPDEVAQEEENQATANLLWAVDAPEAILRLLLGETDIEQAFSPPEGYDPEQQGEWDSSLITYQFHRRIKLYDMRREPGLLQVTYQVEDLGYWTFEVTPERVTIERA